MNSGLYSLARTLENSMVEKNDIFVISRAPEVEHRRELMLRSRSLSMIVRNRREKEGEKEGGGGGGGLEWRDEE